LNGPVLRTLINSEGHGVHVSWMYSASELSSYPDRTTRYNYYDHATRAWNWLDPDHMQSGISVMSERAGYGNLAADPLTGVALVAAHMGSPLRPELARDIGPGAGLFEYCSGPDGYLWPVIATGDPDWIHVLMLDDATRSILFYSRCTTWCSWDPPVHLGNPGYPNPVVAASPSGTRVAASWTAREGPFRHFQAYYCESSDRGTTWPAVETLPPPPAFGGDTIAAFTQFSAFPHYDRQDRLHLVAGVQPLVDSLVLVVPSEIWHWCRDNEPRWSRIHRAEEELRAPIGYNGYYACRPSIGEDAAGGLYVAWEQFDGQNFEPRTDLLRADIWWARDNYSNGASWQPAVRLTDPDSTSKRFPCVVDRLDADTLLIAYLVDQLAGFHVQGQGPATDNPVIVHRVPVEVASVGKPGSPRPGPLARLPTVIRGSLFLRPVSCPDHTQSALCLCGSESSPTLLDASGRKVMELQPGENDVRRLAPGVYFIRTALWERSPDRDWVHKVVIQR
ncbi:MAG: hypothetical protein R6X14_02350, partial [bacterium]